MTALGNEEGGRKRRGAMSHSNEARGPLVDRGQTVSIQLSPWRETIPEFSRPPQDVSRPAAFL